MKIEEEKNLREMQEISLKCLRKLAEICKKYNITYFLDSGSLIGAVRHHSLIPWDDDIDVVFKREDYCKLLQVPIEEWGPDFELVTYRDITAEKSFLDFITRVIYTKKTVNLNTFDKASDFCAEKYRNCVPLDCFILDNAYDSIIRQKWMVAKQIIIYGMAMGHRPNMNFKDYTGVTKIVIQILSIVGKHIPLKKIFDMYEKNSQMAPNSSKKLFYSNCSFRNIKLVFEKSWFERTVKVPIDLEFFDAPVGYHNSLTVMYGDYMTLPKVEERLPKHMMGTKKE